jgi:hypothetical protein
MRLRNYILESLFSLFLIGCVQKPELYYNKRVEEETRNLNKLVGERLSEDFKPGKKPEKYFSSSSGFFAPFYTRKASARHINNGGFGLYGTNYQGETFTTASKAAAVWIFLRTISPSARKLEVGIREEFQNGVESLNLDELNIGYGEPNFSRDGRWISIVGRKGIFEFGPYMKTEELGNLAFYFGINLVPSKKD